MAICDLAKFIAAAPTVEQGFRWPETLIEPPGLFDWTTKRRMVSSCLEALSQASVAWPHTNRVIVETVERMQSQAPLGGEPFVFTPADGHGFAAGSERDAPAWRHPGPPRRQSTQDTMDHLVEDLLRQADASSSALAGWTAQMPDLNAPSAAPRSSLSTTLMPSAWSVGKEDEPENISEYVRTYVAAAAVQ